MTDQCIAELISTDGPLMFTEPVLMEVLAGARSGAREEDLRRMLLRFGLAHLDAVTDFDAATRIYSRCRQAGVKPLDSKYPPICSTKSVISAAGGAWSYGR